VGEEGGGGGGGGGGWGSARGREFRSSVGRVLIQTRQFKLMFQSVSMGYCRSVRSRWLDIGQVLLLHVCGPRQS